jgi:hypothetical protein
MQVAIFTKIEGIIELILSDSILKKIFTIKYQSYF